MLSDENANTQSFAEVKSHYSSSNLTKRIAAALEAADLGTGVLSPEQLAPLDQFHTRGSEATLEIAKMADVQADDAVLDVGSGLGGPARFIAKMFGSHVTGIDLSESFVEAAQYLTARTNQQSLVQFQQANALQLPFSDSAFDITLNQHVAMNIDDRNGLYRELRRVTRPGGKLAIHDVVLGSGDPHFPLPWAKTQAESFLLNAPNTLETVERCGFQRDQVSDDTEAAKVWFTSLRNAGPPLILNLGLAMGPEMRQYAENLGRSIMEGKVRILSATFNAV